MKNKKIFITGATGVVGSHLIPSFLNKGFKVECLVRSMTKSLVLRNALKNSVKCFNNQVFKINIGDITKKDLGLDQETIKEMKSNVDYIIHSAALTDYNHSQFEYTKTNCEGLQNLLKVAFSLWKKGRLKRIYYLSTVYVCGNYSRAFDENSLEKNQEFYSEYERSKYDAEKIARKFIKEGLPLTIVRLPAVLGQASNGQIINFKSSFYQGLKILNMQIFDKLPCFGSELNVIFLDEISKFFITILVNEGRISESECYHLVNPRKLRVTRVLSLACKILAIEDPEYVKESKFSYDDITEIQKRMLEYNYKFVNRRCSLDCRKTDVFLKNIGYKYLDWTDQNLANLINFALEKKYLRCAV